jgi:hypothetical protein
MKLCKSCNIEKTLENFIYRKDTERYESKCIDCTKEYLKKYYINNKKNILNNSNLYYKNNTEKVLSNVKTYRDSNIGKVKKWRADYYINNSEKIKEKSKNWRKENKEKRNYQEKNKRENDIIYKLIHNLRCRTNTYFKKKNIDRKSKTFEIIGCSPVFLKEHLEKKFTEGMSWDKMGKYIHIDHIIPLSSAKIEEDLIKLCHYTNLQPLWAEDNLKKNNKIIKKL